MTTPLPNGDSNMSVADGGGRSSARGQNSFSMVNTACRAVPLHALLTLSIQVSPRPLSARMEGQGNEGDIKHELFEVRATSSCRCICVIGS